MSELTREQLEAEIADCAICQAIEVSVDGPEYRAYSQEQTRLIRMIADEVGQIPVRAPASPTDHGRYTYTIPGVDLGEVVDGWRRAGGSVE